jgi:hypothetical protein
VLRTFHGTRHDLVHGTLTGWCYRCHAQPNLDLLVLDDGRPVGFEQSHALCGSCLASACVGRASTATTHIVPRLGR